MNADTILDAADVANAIARYVDASREEEQARERYEGYSWGYHGSALIYERDKARTDLEQRLTAFVDQRIAAALIREDAKL